MSKNKLVITRQNGYVRYGYFCDMNPVELYCEPEENKSIVGNIYAARVERVADGIGGAFLEIEKDKKCYYPITGGKQPVKLTPGHENCLCGGDVILIQIIKEAVKTKLPVGSGNISFQGKYFVLTLVDKRTGISRKISNPGERKRLADFIKQYKNDAYGIVVRTNAQGAAEEELSSEMNSLLTRYRELMRKAGFVKGKTLLYREPPHYITLGKDLPEKELDEILTDQRDIFEELQQYYKGKNKSENDIVLYQDEYPLEKLYRFTHHFEEALHKLVWLKSGGSLVIEQTEAMVVIDVNTGGVTKKKRHAEKLFFQMNKEAAKEIARQLRLRNLSGMIIIDFINMELQKEKETLLQLLHEECKKDRIPCRVMDITALGLVEMTRNKVRRPLHEQISS